MQPDQRDRLDLGDREQRLGVLAGHRREDRRGGAVDLHDQIAVDSYEIPDRISRRVKLKRPTCVFPHCTRTSARVDLDHIDELTRKNLVAVSMQKGDVVLVDNYQCLHGRDVFEGERMHAVTWFQ